MTIFDVPNYGAMLQAYALQRALEALGHDAVAINYTNQHLDGVYRVGVFPPRPTKWLRSRRARAFVRDHVRTSGSRLRSVDDVARVAEQYDVLVTGSDQVWFTGPVQGYDPVYFLDLPGVGTPRISYAPSAGATSNFGSDGPRIRQVLSGYAAISVRDEFTEAVVRTVTDRPLARVVDPVLLHDFAEVRDSHLAWRPVREPYLAVFGNLDTRAASLAREVAASLKLRLVTLQYRLNGGTRVPAPDPWQWMAALRNASCVVTTYFHGAVVPLKFGVPVLCFPTKNRVPKVTALLRDAGVTGALVPATPAEALYAVEAQRAGRAAEESLGPKIAASREWLARSLAEVMQPS
ncbi:MAG: polysaccharide pyruvyl transferase family protein [Planctomycetota bacterium]|nr:polysaccharide pyruvyl transferase family protein [Planctomycetota bacterium]